MSLLEQTIKPPTVFLLFTISSVSVVLQTNFNILKTLQSVLLFSDDLKSLRGNQLSFRVKTRAQSLFSILTVSLISSSSNCDNVHERQETFVGRPVVSCVCVVMLCINDAPPLSLSLSCTNCYFRALHNKSSGQNVPKYEIYMNEDFYCEVVTINFT